MNSNERQNHLTARGIVRKPIQGLGKIPIKLVNANIDLLRENVGLVVLGQLLEKCVDAVDQALTECLHFFHARRLSKVLNVLSEF